MNYVVEPKAGYNLTTISNKLHAMNIAHIIIETDEGVRVIKAELTFNEVCDLKDMAYCIHEESNNF
jgi:hypothetical protein